MIRLRDFREIDFILLFVVLVVVVFGILFIYSSGFTSAGTHISNEYRRQIVWAAAGLAIALFLALFNYRRMYDLSVYFYLITIALLVLTLVSGRFAHGSRWLRLGPITIQVSEFAKITTILFLAWYLDSTKRNKKTFVRFMISCFIVLIPMTLTLIQPDLGTALVFIPILLGMAFIAGISARYITFLGISIVLSGIFLILPLWQTYTMDTVLPALSMLTNTRFVATSCLLLLLIALVAWIGFVRYKKNYFFWICFTAGIIIFSLAASFFAHKVLREYQLMRLVVFMNPNIDPRGSGWHIIQSITAIGSGGAFGMGYLQGTHSQYHFLPEQSTDFIFSIFSEEWGFRGGILLFALFLTINLRLIRIMRITVDTFGSYIVAGLLSMYAFHFFINVGMTMGIMPITGIPLIFMSYGGSSLITGMIGLGFALSVHVRRYIK